MEIPSWEKNVICKNVLTQEKNGKLGIKQQNLSLRSGGENLLNLTNVSVAIRGKGSMNMDMEKGGNIMNITML